MRLVLWLLVAAGGAVASGCDDGPPPGEAWRIAQEKWRNRAVDAHRSWKALDPSSPQGKLAQTLLARADRHYVEGIRLLEAGHSAEGKQKLMEGAGIAPIDPVYYFKLAVMYDGRDLDELAFKYYQKCIEALPGTPFARESRIRIADVDTIFDPPKAAPPDHRGRNAALLGGLMVVLVIGLLLWMRRGGGTALSTLVDRHPELHSAIAYLVGSMRHELLKHRIGAVSDVLAGWNIGEAKAAQRDFLLGRLYGGVPVNDAWQAHLAAFRGALGHRLNLQRDRAFRRAGRAVRVIQRLQAALAAPEPGDMKRLLRAHQTLKRFDAFLADLQGRLVRTRVDHDVFQQVVDEVRGEYTVSAVRLDSLESVSLSSPVFIEVPRADLVLILKNILRNAILAVAKQDTDRLVRMYAEVVLEETGEEAVHLGVADSGEAPFDGEGIARRGIHTGLGLVGTAVKRYGGSVSVIDAAAPLVKAVDIRFFRAFENGPGNGRSV